MSIFPAVAAAGRAYALARAMPLLDPTADVLDALAEGAPVFLPVNPIEYHGPHLSLRNDHLVSVGLARDLHEALASAHGPWPLLVARDLDVGVDPAPGPGSIAVPFAEVRRRVVAACDQLVDRGAQRVVLTTFHGSPLHALALEAGVRRLAARGVRALSPLNLVLRELLDVDGSRYAEAFASIDDAALRATMMRELPDDFHAGFFETSMAMHYAPDSVLALRERLPPCPDLTPARVPAALARLASALGATTLGHELSLSARGLAWYALRPFPGYTGKPHLASARAGAAFAAKIVERYVEAAEAVLFGDAPSPAPIMRWMAALSLGGRLGPRVPLDAVVPLS